MLRIATLIAVVGTIVLTACGGDGDTLTAPTQAPAPPASDPPPDRTAAIAAASSLLSTPSLYLTVASATLSWNYAYTRSAPGSDACPLSGSKRILLDGTPSFASLPTGKHIVAAQFDGCRSAGPMQDLVLDGGVDLTYEGSPMGSISALVTLKRLFADGLIGDGPASYTIEQQPQVSRHLIDLSPSATLTNPVTNKRVDFVSGRYRFVHDESVQPTTDTQEFLGVTLDLDGVRYVLDGRSVVRSSSCSGEVRITDGNGGLAARVYCSPGGIREYELLKPIPLFW